MAKKKSSPKAHAAVVALLICIAVCGVVFLHAYTPRGTKVVDSTGVLAYLKSSDGQNHSLLSDISIRFDAGVRGLDEDELHARLAAIVSGLQYEKISAVGGIDYMQGEISAVLSKHYSAQDIQNVYVTALISDGPPVASGGGADSSVMGSLFQSMD